ncbi:putative acyl-CoA dehydrogenase IBR3 [Hordeum vulgare]|nr:putative acyl-CoA dehydrogenase IBR3 [Hordeum vulgare]
MAMLTSDLLRPVHEAYALDEATLLRYTAAHVPGFPAPVPALALTQFGHGQSNPTYCLKASAPGGEPRRYVLWKKPAGAILQSAHAVEREFQVRQRSSSSALAAHLGSRSPIPLPPVGGGLSCRWSALPSAMDSAARDLAERVREGNG